MKNGRRRCNLISLVMLFGCVWGSLIFFGEGALADERLYFVHRTNTFPVPEMKVGGVRYAVDLKNPIAAQVPYRMTLHWSMGTIKPNLVFDLGDGKVVDAVSLVNKYIVVESFSGLSDRIIGGWLDDFFIVGPYTLSSESTLILPASEANRPELKGFHGRLVPYAEGSSGDEALRDLLETKQVEIRIFPLFVGDLEESRLMALFKRFGTSGQPLIELVQTMDPGQKICPTITLAENGTTKITISKIQEADDLAYLYEDPKNFFGRFLCTRYEKELTPIPMSTVLLISSGQEQNTNAINLRKLFPKAPYLTYGYHSTHFGNLEDAIKEGKWEEATRLLSLIREALAGLDLSILHVDKFVKSLEEAKPREGIGSKGVDLL